MLQLHASILGVRILAEELSMDCRLSPACSMMPGRNGSVSLALAEALLPPLTPLSPKVIGIYYFEAQNLKFLLWGMVKNSAWELEKEGRGALSLHRSAGSSLDTTQSPDPHQEGAFSTMPGVSAQVCSSWF